MCVQKFDDFADPLDTMTAAGVELEVAMVDYFSALYTEGLRINRAKRTVAGWMCYSLSYIQFGSASVAKVWKCSKGWTEMVPGRSQGPQHLGVWGAILWALRENGHPDIALFAGICLARS